MNRKVILYSLVMMIFVLIVLVLFMVIKNLKNEGSKELELTYTINSGIPYKWEFEIEDESIVKFVRKHDIEVGQDGIAGAPVSTNYVFKGLKEGKTTITFKKVSIVDGSVEEESKNTIKVDKKLNISLVAISK